MTTSAVGAGAAGTRAPNWECCYWAWWGWVGVGDLGGPFQPSDSVIYLGICEAREVFRHYNCDLVLDLCLTHEPLQLPV